MKIESSPCAKRFPLSRICLAGLQWQEPGGDGAPLICVHGWLDNAASFQLLAPRLSSERPVIAIDLPGHGYSDHRPPGYAYNLLDYVQDLADLIAILDRPVHVVGHSLGGIIASLYAATRPDNLFSLTLIDSLGPYVAEAEDFPQRLAKGIGKALAGSGKGMPVYDSIEAAEAARQGGTLPLSPVAAHQLVSRNLRPVDGGWTWRTDPRLRKPSLSMLTEAQVLASFKAIAVPALVVQAEGGMLNGDSRFRARRSALQHGIHETLAGSHHLHLDGDLSRLSKMINDFVGSPRRT